VYSTQYGILTIWDVESMMLLHLSQRKCWKTHLKWNVAFFSEPRMVADKVNFPTFVIIFKIKIYILNKTLMGILNKIYLFLFNHISMYSRNEYHNNKFLNINTHQLFIKMQLLLQFCPFWPTFTFFYGYKMTSGRTWMICI